jgi:hypothetical protein
MIVVNTEPGLKLALMFSTYRAAFVLLMKELLVNLLIYAILSK